ncbi:MAG: exodeoxyribonuclease VII large subunit [Candidatus Woesebacteria bacterium]|nr:exodeoxyribonuclease VII large subunit [Candidatus Woesebacteria bacterium]
MTEEKIFQVSEFNEFINLYLGKVGEVVVEGEITRCEVKDGKWLFVTIKDKESSVEIFGTTFQISGYSVLEPGMLVHVYGTPRLYQKTGRFSVYASQIVPAGEGALKLAFEKLKGKLEQEGLFSEQRKRTITKFPENIGLITAKDSRAYSDFIKVLKNRMGGIHIHFYPVNVQGKTSVESIVRAFDFFNKNLPGLDALILIRGGGSLEDLQAFNDEELARAIFSSKVPVVCGVGHEDDLTIADLVSDLRASTPSNTAELLVRDRDEVLFQVQHNVQTINNELEKLLSEAEGKIRKSVYSLGNAINAQVSSVKSTISKFTSNFVLFKREIVNLSRNMYTLVRRISKGSNIWLGGQQTKIENMVRLLNSFDVQKTMKRGFSITFDDRGNILKTIKHLSKGSRITTDLFDGKIGAQVLNINKK